jgi:hypothetical protein
MREEVRGTRNVVKHWDVRYESIPLHLDIPLWVLSVDIK